MPLSSDDRISMQFRCPLCGVPPGHRCQTVSGNWARHVHALRAAPRFICPRCQGVTFNAHNVAAGYCPDCGDWTGGGSGPGQPALAIELVNP